MKNSTLISIFSFVALIQLTACSPEKEQNTETLVQKEKPAAHSTEQLEFPKLETLEKLLSQAKKENKNCLLYFSGWVSVNSRKLEDQLFIKEEIREIITNNFVYAIAYVDEMKKLPGETQPIGEKHMKLQQEKFNSTSQPMLYILSPDGEIIASWTYEYGPDTFKYFLEKGTKK